MKRYMMVYLGGTQPTDPKKSEEHFKKYREWLGSLGDSLISPANPLKDTNTITPNGVVSPGSISEMSGFTVLQANSMQAVIEMAKSCPFLEIGGTLEVSELMQMNEE